MYDIGYERRDAFSRSETGCRAHAPPLGPPALAHRLRDPRTRDRYWREYWSLQRRQCAAAAFPALSESRTPGGAAGALVATPRQRHGISQLAQAKHLSRRRRP